MSIIGYARCSTVEQSTDLQVARLKEAGAEQVFSEKRSGADTKNRIELENAMRSLRAGDVLMVTKLDRFGRNTLDLLKLIERVRAAGAEFRCLDQPVSTDGPMGQLMLTMLGAFAQFENDIRKERQMEGIAAAKARGVYDPKRHAISPGRLSHASRLLRQGLSYVQAAEKTGISVDTLQRKFPGYKSRVAVEREAAKKAKPVVGFDHARPGGELTTVATIGDGEAASYTVVSANIPKEWIAPEPPAGFYSAQPPKRRGLFGVFGR